MMIQLSSFFIGDSTLSHFSKYKVDFESPFNSTDTTLSFFSNCNHWVKCFCENTTLSPFFTRDTTLSSFSNRDSTLSPSPSITLSYSSSKGRLWMFICMKDMYECMGTLNFFECMYECMRIYFFLLWMNENFKFLFLSECIFEWMETLSFSFWMMNNAWNFEFLMMNGAYVNAWNLIFLNENAYLNAGWFDLCLFEECMTFLPFLKLYVGIHDIFFILNAWEFWLF